LLELHRTTAGRRVLALGRLERFAAVSDEDYAPIRAMEHAAREVVL
jgi:hypothetical protein